MRPGLVLASCASCGGASICVNNTCKPNHLRRRLRRTAPETCDPPERTETCDTTCQKHRLRQRRASTGSEQCDDGNTTNLDGCDQYCNFEQIQRATSLQYSTRHRRVLHAQRPRDAVITPIGLSVIQSTTDMDVGERQDQRHLQVLGHRRLARADLSGTSGAVVMGSLSGSPAVRPTPARYDGTNDLDWWYTVDPTTVDGNRNPLATTR